MTKLRSVDFVVDRIERGESNAEIAEAEGLELWQIEAVREMLEGDEPENDGDLEEEGEDE